MTLQERCQASEVRLRALSEVLLDPRPEVLDHCEEELRDVIALLEGNSAEALAELTTVDRAALLGLQQSARRLAWQVQHAANLCQGWAQLRLSEGYTEEGRPVLLSGAPRTSYEV